MSSGPNHDAKKQKGKTEKRQNTKIRKTNGRLQVSTKIQKIAIYMMHEQYQRKMHSLMQWE